MLDRWPRTAGERGAAAGVVAGAAAFLLAWPTVPGPTGAAGLGLAVAVIVGVVIVLGATVVAGVWAGRGSTTTSDGARAGATAAAVCGALGLTGAAPGVATALVAPLAAYTRALPDTLDDVERGHVLLDMSLNGILLTIGGTGAVWELGGLAVVVGAIAGARSAGGRPVRILHPTPVALAGAAATGIAALSVVVLDPGLGGLMESISKTIDTAHREPIALTLGVGARPLAWIGLYILPMISVGIVLSAAFVVLVEGLRGMRARAGSAVASWLGLGLGGIAVLSLFGGAAANGRAPLAVFGAVAAAILVGGGARLARVRVGDAAAVPVADIVPAALLGGALSLWASLPLTLGALATALGPIVLIGPLSSAELMLVTVGVEHAVWAFVSPAVGGLALATLASVLKMCTLGVIVLRVAARFAGARHPYPAGSGWRLGVLLAVAMALMQAAVALVLVALAD